MKNNSSGTVRLWILLAGLAVLIALVIALDSLPVSQTVSQKISSETLLSDMLTDTLPPETTAVIAAPSTEPSATTSSVTESDSISEDAAEPPQTTPPMPEKKQNAATLTFLGACSPGSPMGTTAYGSLNSVAQNKGYSFFFSQLADILQTDDLTVAANSCAFTDTFPSSDLTCAAPPSQTEIYSAGGIDLVSLSTPLFRDTSQEYLLDTQNALDEQFVPHAKENSVSFLEINDIRIALYFTVVEKGGNSSASVQTIRTAADEADFVVVYFWSADTISSTPEEWLRYILHQFADAGASLIVGVSEGEIRPVEQYGKATIAYSLGSIINGASFSVDSVSVLLQLTLEKQTDGSLQSEITIRPCSFFENRWQPMLLPAGETKSRIDAFLTGDTDLPLVNQ